MRTEPVTWKLQLSQPPSWVREQSVDKWSTIWQTILAPRAGLGETLRIGEDQNKQGRGIPG
jgi:hypothetical protein